MTLAASLATAREQLAPAALDAYPEAYAEFQNAMLLLLRHPAGAAASDKEEEDIEVFGETEASLDAARDELTATLAATLRQQCGAYDPALSLLLRYLVRARSFISPAQPLHMCRLHRCCSAA